MGEEICVYVYTCITVTKRLCILLHNSNILFNFSDFSIWNRY